MHIGNSKLLPLRPLHNSLAVLLMCEGEHSHSWASGLWLQKCGNWFGQMWWVRLWNKRCTERKRNRNKERNREGTLETQNMFFMGSHVDWKEGNKKYNTCSKNNENTVTNTIFILSCFYLLGGSYRSISTPSPFLLVSLALPTITGCLFVKKKKMLSEDSNSLLCSPYQLMGHCYVVDLWPPWRSACKLWLHIEIEWLDVNYIWMIIRKGFYFLRLWFFLTFIVYICIADNNEADRKWEERGLSHATKGDFFIVTSGLFCSVRALNDTCEGAIPYLANN